MSAMTFAEHNKVKWVGIRPAHNGEQVRAYVNINGGSALLYTVPVGKIFYLCFMSVWNSNNSTGSGFIEIKDSSGVRMWLPIFSNTYVNTSAMPAIASFNPPVEFSNNESFYGVSSVAAFGGYFHMHGWVE